MEILLGSFPFPQLTHSEQSLIPTQVFICVMAVGIVWAWFYIPETKGVPLEELAALFGDDDEIVVYMKDIHVDHNTHELVVDKQRGVNELGRVVTEFHGPSHHKAGVEEIEGSPTKGMSEKNVTAESV